MDFSQFTSKKYTKGTIIQFAGQKKLKTYFVEKGLLRAYQIDRNGKEHTYMFGPENWIVGDIYAIFQKQESNLFIDVLEDSDVRIIEQYDFDFEKELLQEGLHKAMNRIGVLQNRVLMLLSSSAKERYDYFLSIYPDINQRVPQKLIASYLGITPQALSRIRAKNY
jgi:CRP-like cAMP-binding protein